MISLYPIAPCNIFLYYKLIYALSSGKMEKLFSSPCFVIKGVANLFLISLPNIETLMLSAFGINLAVSDISTKKKVAFLPTDL